MPFLGQEYSSNTKIMKRVMSLRENGNAIVSTRLID